MVMKTKVLAASAVAAVLLVMGAANPSVISVPISLAAAAPISVAAPFAAITASAADVIDISNASYLLSNKDPAEFSTVYTGREVKPVARLVLDDGTKINPTTSYFDITYEDNINAGTAKLTITGKGTKYSGTKEIYYQISPKTLTSSALTLNQTVFSYAGQPVEPEVTVKNGTEVIDSSLYTVTYEDNNAPGKGLVIVTFNEGGNFTGTIQKNFTIGKQQISEDIVSLTRDVYTYTGAAAKPGVKWDGITLTPDDYTVTYSNNVKAGTATARIVMKGNYSGTFTKTFTINPANASVIPYYTGGNQLYTGKAVEPVPEMKYFGYSLKKGTDYTVTYEDNVAVGTGYMNITFKGNFTGEKRVPFLIRTATLSTWDISLAAKSDEFEYTGQPIEPKVVVKSGTKVLQEGVDYRVSYSANTNVGSPARCTIIDLNSSSSVGRVIPFTITKGKLKQNASVVRAGYNNGTRPDVNFNIKNTAGVVLTEGKDYVVNYETDNFNITASNSPILATVTGINNYEGEFTKKVYISSRAISADMVYFAQNGVIGSQDAVFAYTGEAVTPEIAVVASETHSYYDASSDSSVTLQEGVDYTVTYSNNIKSGTGRITVKGIGNYGGTAYKNFTISPTFSSADNIEVSVNNGYPVRWIGGQLPSNIMVTVNGTKLTNRVDYTITSTNIIYDNDQKPVQHFYKIDFKGNYTGSYEGAFNYELTPFHNASITYDKYFEYSGLIQRPDFHIVLPNGTELQEGIDYTVENPLSSKSSEIGHYSVVIKGINDYENEYVYADYYIGQSLEGLKVDGIPEQNYTGSAVTPNIRIYNSNGVVLEKNKDYVLTYENNIEPGDAIVTVVGKGNYTGERTMHFKITQKTLDEAKIIFAPTSGGTTLDLPRYLYTGQEIDITRHLYVTVGSQALQRDSDYTLEYLDDHTSPGKHAVLLTGISGYTGSKIVEFYISENIKNARVQLPSWEGNELIFISNGNHVYPYPDVFVTEGEIERPLEKEMEYSVYYISESNKAVYKEDSYNGIQQKVVGIQGQGKYSGYISRYYKLQYADFDCTATLKSTLYGDTADISDMVFIIGNESISSKDYTYSVSDVHDGYVTVSLTVLPSAAIETTEGIFHYTGTIEKEIPVSEGSSDGLTAKPVDWIMVGGN